MLDNVGTFVPCTTFVSSSSFSADGAYILYPLIIIIPFLVGSIRRHISSFVVLLFIPIEKQKKGVEFMTTGRKL